MPSQSFKISQIGREKLATFHRVNKETLLEDPLIKEYDEKDILSVLKVTQQNFRDTGKLMVKKNSQYQQDQMDEKTELTPLNDILSGISKEEILKKKKKKPLHPNDIEISPLANVSSSSAEQGGIAGVVQQPNKPPEFILSYSRPAFSANVASYFGTNNLKQKSAVRVTLYNKGFERDLM